jgi:hypothetical protein
MKSFTEYLTESKKIYEFKVKIAGDCPKDCAKQIKEILAQFKVDSCSSGKSTPIQETLVDFPDCKNIGMTIFDITTSYPATSLQIQSLLAEKLRVATSMLKVRNLEEEKELAINNQHNVKTGKAMLGTDYENSNNEDLVGETHKMNFLKGLSKGSHQGTPVTGYNDDLLAKSAPKHNKETPAKQVKVKNNAVNIFTKQVKVPTAKG